jgi:PhnB protein
MAVNAIPEGYHAVCPYLIVREVEQLVEFVKQVFGVKERLRSIGSAGGLHVEVEIGDSLIMLGGGPAVKQTSTAALHVYVADVDAVYRRALQAGATSLAEPLDQSYGDRVATVVDASGNTWYLATRIAESAINA